MNILNANLTVLKKRFPAAYTALRNCQPSPGDQATFANKHLQLHLNQRRVYPYGEVDADALAQRWLQGFHLKDKTLYGLTGFGDGTHLKALLRHCPPSSTVLVADAHPGLMAQILSHKNCTDILNDKRLQLCIGPCTQNLFKILGELELDQYKQLQPLIFAPLFALGEAYYHQYLIGLAQNFDAYLHNYMSAIRSSGYHQEQCMRNLPKLFHAPDIGSTRGLFQGQAVIIAGAGPSLDESIEFLRAAQQHAIVVSVNSSHRKLVNSGICPDVTVAADPRIFTYRGYESVTTAGSYLVCPFFVSPPVVEKFAPKIFTWALNQPMIEIFKSRAQLNPPTPIAEMGTVSSCVVDLARLWGCTKVCLVGQDFALGEDGKSHTSDSFYSDAGQNYSSTQNCRKLPGNTLAQVHVDDKLFVYLKAFEQLVEDYTMLSFINTAPLGAAVKGIPYYEHTAALKWLKAEASPDAKRKLESLLVTHESSYVPSSSCLIHLLEPSLVFAEKLYGLALEAALYHQHLPSAYSHRSYAKHAKVKQALAYADKINRLLDRYPQDYAILFNGEAKKHLSKFNSFKKSVCHPTVHWQAIVENHAYFWALAESAHFMRSRLSALKRECLDPENEVCAKDPVHCGDLQTTL